MRRIYLDTPLAVGQKAPLSGDAFHYAVRVLRCRDGERLIIFNGDGNDYTSTLEVEGKKNAALQVESVAKNNNESPLHTTLIQGLSKGERMDIVMQKAVELGVNTIIPVRSEFCAVKLDEARLAKKIQHWQAIIISACEQSERAVIPELKSLQQLATGLPDVVADEKWILHPCRDGDEKAPFESSISNLEKAHSKAPKSAAILVGPEGGFSDAEVVLARQHHFIPKVFGGRILRTETAALAALSLCQYQWGDWHV